MRDRGRVRRRPVPRLLWPEGPDLPLWSGCPPRERSLPPLLEAPTEEPPSDQQPRLPGCAEGDSGRVLPASTCQAAGIAPGWSVVLSPAAWDEALEPGGPADALALARRVCDLLTVLVARLREPGPDRCPVILDLVVDVGGRLRLRRLAAAADPATSTVHVLCPWELC